MVTIDLFVLTARGFKDKMQELETYAGTTSRCGQRLVNLVAAEHEDFVLFSFDVSQAFAKGMTFKELSELTGLELREVQFDIPFGDVEILRLIPAFKGYDPSKECLNMIKPIVSATTTLRNVIFPASKAAMGKA